MSTKRENDRAASAEPVFVLRAKDPFAAAVVRIWASLAQWHHGHAKAGEAWQVARDMESWRAAQTDVKNSFVGPAEEWHTS